MMKLINTGLMVAGFLFFYEHSNSYYLSLIGGAVIAIVALVAIVYVSYRTGNKEGSADKEIQYLKEKVQEQERRYQQMQNYMYLNAPDQNQTRYIGYEKEKPMKYIGSNFRKK